MILQLKFITHKATTCFILLMIRGLPKRPFSVKWPRRNTIGKWIFPNQLVSPFQIHETGNSEPMHILKSAIWTSFAPIGQQVRWIPLSEAVLSIRIFYEKIWDIWLNCITTIKNCPKETISETEFIFPRLEAY